MVGIVSMIKDIAAHRPFVIFYYNLIDTFDILYIVLKQRQRNSSSSSKERVPLMDKKSQVGDTSMNLLFPFDNNVLNF